MLVVSDLVYILQVCSFNIGVNTKQEIATTQEECTDVSFQS